MPAIDTDPLPVPTPDLEQLGQVLARQIRHGETGQAARGGVGRAHEAPLIELDDRIRQGVEQGVAARARQRGPATLDRRWPSSVPRRRWRATSKHSTAAAIPTFRDCAPGAMGMLTRLSIAEDSSPPSPWASFPSTSAAGATRSTVV